MIVVNGSDTNGCSTPFYSDREQNKRKKVKTKTQNKRGRGFCVEESSRSLRCLLRLENFFSLAFSSSFSFCFFHFSLHWVSVTRFSIERRWIYYDVSECVHCVHSALPNTWQCFLFVYTIAFAKHPNWTSFSTDCSPQFNKQQCKIQSFFSFCFSMRIQFHFFAFSHTASFSHLDEFGKRADESQQLFESFNVDCCW